MLVLWFGLSIQGEKRWKSKWHFVFGFREYISKLFCSLMATLFVNFEALQKLIGKYHFKDLLGDWLDYLFLVIDRNMEKLRSPLFFLHRNAHLPFHYSIQARKSFITFPRRGSPCSPEKIIRWLHAAISTKFWFLKTDLGLGFGLEMGLEFNSFEAGAPSLTSKVVWR